jgi:zinc protease
MTSSTPQAYTLPNGLLVLTKEVHSAPVATCWVWYRVGSRNETTGLTGISHWVEHMLFKGTPNMPVGTMDRLIARNGGVFNAFTWIDFTAYYETLPADRIELALQIESDRMINALFDPEETESERTVILSELDGYANYPETWLDEAVKATSFVVHPYHHPVIGFRNDVVNMSRDDLFQHYQTYYMPNNAVIVLVGDFDTDTIRDKVASYFADLPVGPALPKFYAVEPEAQGERRFVVRRPGPAEYVEIAYVAPDCRSADFAPMVVLDAVLSGAKSLSFDRQVQTNRSARIYKALVETQLASSASSSYQPTFDPYVFELFATVDSNHKASEIEAALLEQIAMIQQDGVKQDELDKVIKQVRAQIAYSMESVTNQAFVLGMWEIIDPVDGYKRVDMLLDEFSAVKAEDVQRVAQTYLVHQRMTVGHFIPTEDAGGTQ